MSFFGFLADAAEKPAISMPENASRTPEKKTRFVMLRLGINEWAPE